MENKQNNNDYYATIQKLKIIKKILLKHIFF